MQAKLRISWDLIEQTLGLPNTELCRSEVGINGDLIVVLSGAAIDEAIGTEPLQEGTAIPEITAIVSTECRFEKA